MRGMTLVMVAAWLLVSACGGATTPVEHGGAGHGAVHWAYTGEGAPEHWGELSEEFATCGTGQAQSPIDIVGAAGTDLPGLVFHYQAAPLSLINNGHAIEQEFPEGSTLESSGRTYTLKQFHVHGPSEHTLNGQSFPMEMHFVHRAEDGSLAVVGLWLREGAANAALEGFFANMPTAEARTAEPEGLTLDPAAVLPADRTYARYSGSLTTPPCTEGVAWHMLQQPIEASAEQLARFAALYSGTNRPVQPLHERALELDNTP